MKNNRTMVKFGRSALLLTLLVLAGCASNVPAPVLERGTPSSEASAVAAKDTYVVKSGDTLYSIARENGIDHRELIALNGIENPNQISVGRVLKIKPKAAADSAVAATAPITTDVVVAKPIGGEPVVEPGTSSGNTETLKREPKAGKAPYSDQALAQAQGSGQQNSAGTAQAVTGSDGAKPESKPTDAPAGPDEIDWIWPANGKMIGTFSEGGSKGVDISGKAGDPVIASGDGKIVYSGTGLRGYGKLVIIKHNNTYLSAYAHNQTILVKEGQSVSKGQKIAEMGNSDADQVKLHFEVRRQGKPVDPLNYLPQR